MNRDPFYNQIVERLNGKLDPDLFELCADDLLRSIYPTLVPIRGGDDAGMDGAIADAQGEPFPLVTTTADHVIGNLTRNLNSYLDRGGARRKVVLATSQHLTQRRRKNLFDRASELGFTLINVHDQSAMANLLYRSPEWCQELLNLAGDPSPLSAVPRTTRPQLTNTLIGRDDDLKWLRDGSGDRLLVGQPGTGKTSLLRTLVDDGEALFVISQDRGEIAAGLRRQEGAFILIVDDAHLYSELIPDLIQLREETEADFSTLASCWPSFAPAIANSLNLTEQRIHTLALLSRDDMVSVIKSAGLQGPNRLIKEIIDQAQGRPGLAVTLTSLCLQGGVSDLLSGAVLQRSLRSILKELNLERRVQLVLASLAVGGDGGMAVDDVVEYLGLSQAEVWEALTHLDDSGIVYEFSQGRVSVQPRALRHALVRDVFFDGAGAPPIERLLDRAPNLSDTAKTLLGAKARGAQIPEQLLVDVLRLADSNAVWKEYAWRGRQEARWVFSNLPERTVAMAHPLLAHVPETVIPELLEWAIGDNRALHSYPNHPLRLLKDWIKQAHSQKGQAFFRRQMLLKAVRAWLQEGKDVDVGFKALEWTLFPGFDFSSADPGAGDTVTLHFGLLPTDEIEVIAGLWDEVLSIIEEVQIEQWEPVKRIIEDWVYPSRATIGRAVPNEVSEQMRDHASRMLEDVIPLAHGRPGVMQWAATMAGNLDLDVEIPLDEDYQILYPGRELGGHWRAARERQAAAARDLAADWSNENPDTIVERIAFLEAEAKQGQSSSERWTPLLCTQIAQQVDSVAPWLEAFLRVDVTGDLLFPFLNQIAQAGEPGWQEYAVACLDHRNYEPAAISVMLRLEEPPQEIFSRVLEKLSEYTEIIKTLCLRNEVPEATLDQLLRHESPAVATAAAAGEWNADPRNSVRESARESWREAVVNHVTEEYWLKQAFQRDPVLAISWLEYQINRDDFLTLGRRREDSIKAATDALDVESRKQLLNKISPHRFQSAQIAACLVGDELDVFAALLSSERLKELHLVPLSGYPEGAWIQKAQLALNAGYRAEEIAQVVIRMPWTWSGNESDMWAEWVERLERLCSHEDEHIRTVGIIARERAKEKQRQALQREREEAVFGRR